jgi:hypothetical protein
MEVNAVKMKYTVTFRHQNVGQHHNIMIANESIEIVAKFKEYLDKTVTNQNCIHDKIKSR